MLAAWQGSASVIELLHGAKALLNSQNGQGSTPLATAAQYGREDACRALLAAGADVDLADGRGRTALDVAKERGREAIVALLSDPPPVQPAPAIAALEESLHEVQLD